MPTTKTNKWQQQNYSPGVLIELSCSLPVLGCLLLHIIITMFGSPVGIMCCFVSCFWYQFFFYSRTCDSHWIRQSLSTPLPGSVIKTPDLISSMSVLYSFNERCPQLPNEEINQCGDMIVKKICFTYQISK